jgi:Cu2+-containing amine oxidase
VELSPNTAKKLNDSDMEWLCTECATVGGLGKQYLWERRLDLAVNYCKELNDHSIYADVIKTGRVE